jgi:hypothetical protein
MGYKFNPFTGNLDVVDTTAAAGATTQVQFNDAGAFGGDSGLTFNKTTDALSAGGFIPTSSTVPANGVYLPAANSVGVATNGTGRLFVDANGFVGIGAVNTGSTGAQLSTTTTSSTARLIVESTNAAGYTGLRVANGTGHWEMQVDGANQGLRWLDDGSERLRITSAGLVGIGTSSVSHKLHVFESSTAQNYIVSGAGSITAVLGTQNSAGVAQEAFVGTLSSSDFKIKTNNSEVARFTTSGRLGIGTIAPTELLSIGSGTVNSRTAVGGSSLSLLAGGYTVTGAGSSIELGNGHGNSGDVASWLIRSVVVDGAGPTIKNNQLTFSTRTAFANVVTERVRLDSSGRVGIGNTAPGQALDVVGSINLTGNHTFSTTTSPLIAATAASSVLRFGTGSGGTERARIDDSGRLLIGTSTARNKFFNTTYTPQLQLEGVGQQQSMFSLVNSVADNGGSVIALGKQRSGTIGGNTIVNSGDNVGHIDFFGSDGTEMVALAEISARVDGTPGANDMPGRLVFSTTADGASSPTERMRIGSNGLFSTFFETNGITSRSAASNGTTSFLYRGMYNGTGTTAGGSVSYYVYTNGNVENTNNSYGAISDVKLKENIVDAGSQWDDLKALQVRKYNFKEGQTHTQIGLIAQEVELVSPGLVSESPDRDEEGNDLGTVTKSVNYSVLYMKAVKALQEAMERIETLEAKVAALEGA